MFIITIYTYIGINIQKKRREMVRYEWKGMLIIQDDERDVSRSCGARWWTVGGIDRVLIGCWSGWGKLSRTLLLIVGGCAKLIFDLISYHYVIYAYMIIYGQHTLGRLGGIPYMVEVNDIEGLYQQVRDISGITTYEWAWRDGIMSTDMWLTVGRLGVLAFTTTLPPALSLPSQLLCVV